MDKNRPAAIAPIFEFVIEFLQLILPHCLVFAIDFFLQSSFLQLSFFQSSFAIEFFAIEFLKSSSCNQVLTIECVL